jgi:Na+-translocating ferredoxin:NAD+ oxidoreductase RnfC subunit
MADGIVEKVKAAGVVGAGGAGFPTHVKMSAQVDTVIANGAECEPLLYGDQHLMEAHPEWVVRGIRLVAETTGAERAIIATKREYHDAVAALEGYIEESGLREPSAGAPVSLHLVEESTYPAGDEFELVYEVTGRLIPTSGLPLDVGCVMQNVETLANIRRAVDEGKPVTERTVTLTGEVQQPKTVHLPIGMRFAEALALAGGAMLPEGDYSVVVGGPMMGRLAESLQETVTKTTSSLIVLPNDNVVVRDMARPLEKWQHLGKSTCDQCRDCTTLCPRYLLGHDLHPHEIMRARAYEIDVSNDVLAAALLCCECRLCEAYACPLHLSPVAFYKDVKRQLAEQGYRPPKETDFSPHAFREFRLVPIERLVGVLGLRKYMERECVIDDTPVHPREVLIPLTQHIGAPSVPTVSVGNTVVVGDTIAAIPEGKLGANVHASIDGTVTEVSDQSIAIAA